MSITKYLFIEGTSRFVFVAAAEGKASANDDVANFALKDRQR